jgi:hypothetical protein
MGSEPQAPRRWRRIGAIVVLVALVAFLLVGLNRYYFPYGRHPSCNVALKLALSEYAQSHGGRFPDSGGSGASLGLLAADFPQWSIIAGKGRLAEAAERYYRTNGTLSDELSNWHYVPGLTEDSDPRLALFWDKTGLSHAGMRQKPVRYEVSFVDGGGRLVDEAEWPSFLEGQRKLRQEERVRRSGAK